MCVFEGMHSLIESGRVLMSLVDLRRVVGKGARVRDSEGSGQGI